ncbi:tRNA (adenosine(37)-N6)-dimethylallyltransferase MiaA [Ilyomonas limi]|uniref:tRNA dimethylallyltransferase n=1 Tax=Ilyomonas limi TaxID=2575867 RepID=A0A4U3L5U5_9BACT|nr:tRNA (adenosine(37)-N6)-dimethylallyltransferase MiaA [Ilyomonas limi]TKK69769.1 tRNA (adenosine(37)-N6)-dimethylallyltransferase MiaA [Ilyomonas limi]
MNNQQAHTIIIIAGPTAVGKTGVAIQLAQHFNTSIISADSRQCFRELNIGVAKPTPAQLAAVKHYFINTYSIDEEVTAATFEQYALDATQTIFKYSPIAVMAGGTGLYIKAFCDGLDEMPAIPAHIRQQIITAYEQQGIAFLQEELAQKDPVFWQTAEQQNQQRLMRALEVLYATGKSITTYRNNTPVNRSFNIIKIGLELPREILYQHINYRVDEMIREGLIAEVNNLLPYQRLNALQTVGYKELFDYFNNNISLQKAIENIKQNTRHYAKRQMTWFKKNKDFTWFAPDDYNNIIKYILDKVA